MNHKAGSESFWDQARWTLFYSQDAGERFSGVIYHSDRLVF